MLKRLKTELEQLRAFKQLRELVPAQYSGSAHVEIKGRAVVDFTNWDVLGLADKSGFRHYIQGEIAKNGFGRSSARSASGTSQLHLNCEHRLAQFFASDAATIFSSKNQAVLSLITSLACERDLIFMEEELQSPVADAALLVNCPVVTFAEVRALETEMEKAKHVGEKLVFLQSVSPLTGEPLGLVDYLKLAERYQARLFVDESYSVGWLGLRGTGGSELAGAAQEIFCQFASLGYGLASYGAAVAGNRLLVDFLISSSKTFASEPAPPNAMAAAIEAAINQVELDHASRAKLRRVALEVRHELANLGYPAVAAIESPIVTLSFADSRTAREVQDALFAKGYLVERVNSGRFLQEARILRLVLRAVHQEADIKGLLGALADIKAKLTPSHSRK